MLLSRRKPMEATTYSLDFAFLESPHAGFAFPCDEHGNLKPLNPCAQKNLEKCLSGEHKVGKPTIQTMTCRWTEPASGKCDECGSAMTFEHFTNTCECGADYNSAGQLLAPREQWGEETGESVADILSVDYNPSSNNIEF